MSLIKALTPAETEEIKPGLFIQKGKNGNYRVINPIAWKGEWRLNKQFAWRNLITIVIVLFLAWSYFNETSYCRELKEDPCFLLENLTNYCSANLGDVFNEEFVLEGVDDDRRKNLYALQGDP